MVRGRDISLASLICPLLVVVLTGVALTCADNYTETVKCKYCGFINKPPNNVSCDAPVDVECDTLKNFELKAPYRCSAVYAANPYTLKPNGTTLFMRCASKEYFKDEDDNRCFMRSYQNDTYFCYCTGDLCDSKGYLDKEYQNQLVEHEQRKKEREERERKKAEEEEEQRKRNESMRNSKRNAAPLSPMIGSMSWTTLLWSGFALAHVLFKVFNTSQFK